ncbi:MAG: nucleoside triphosphate pyrophosphohydrolase [Anaerolineae bacterium]
MTLTIIGLGPDSIDHLSLKAWRTLETAGIVYLRTTDHPAVSDLPTTPTYYNFDHLDQIATPSSESHTEMTQILIEQAKRADVVYCVPGDPIIDEPLTTHLQQVAHDAQIQVNVIHGISTIQPILNTLGVQAFQGLQMFTVSDLIGWHHPPINPAYPALIMQISTPEQVRTLQIILSNQYPETFTVSLVQSVGIDAQTVARASLLELAEDLTLSYPCALYVPILGEYTSFEMFQEIIAHLRAPEGCPWDRKQTHQSLRPYLIEEAYEVLETIDNQEWDQLAGELGDLLLQIVLHTQIATEQGEFYMADVLDHVNRKMIRRHPHVWGDVSVDGDAQQVVDNWQAIKQREHEQNGHVRESILDGVPKGAPALMVAHAYQAKAATVGFDWDDVEGVYDKVREELAEIIAENDPTIQAQEIADLIFVLVNWLRWLGVDDPESQIRAVNAKFYRRFRYVEQHAQKPLPMMTLAAMDVLWEEAKSKGL